MEYACFSAVSPNEELLLGEAQCNRLKGKTVNAMRSIAADPDTDARRS